MKKIIYLILLLTSLTTCSKTEVDEITELPKNSGTFFDSRDNHEYRWIKIGEQIWMAENLAFLPLVNNLNNNTEKLPRYYVYDYNGTNINEAKDSLNYITYGVLYNWEAAKTASPAGWHLPSDEEWKQLEIVLGMTIIEADNKISSFFRGVDQGNQLKSNMGWFNSGNGTNKSGFNALPGGYRFSTGNFCFIGKFGYWWTSTECYEGFAWGRGLSSNSNGICRENNFKEHGFSIRCIKD